MNISIHDPSEPLTLTHTLLIYENSSEKIMQRGTIRIVNDQAVITGIENVTDSLDAILRNEKYQPLTYIPPQVVGVTRSACAWYVPAQPRPMFFNPTRDMGLTDLSGRTFPQPPLLMIAHLHTLQVFALQEDARPGLDTPLMAAPYYNMFDNHFVCLGTSFRPQDCTTASLHDWEASFYGSHFTHRAGSLPRWINDRTHRELWLGAEEAGAFDPAWLVDTGLTLQKAATTRWNA